MSDYKMKINEVNKICNDIVDKYSTQIFKPTTSKDELEKLCHALLSSIMSNILALHDMHINMLKNKVESTLDWLNDTDESCDEIYQEKINELNCLCEKLYDEMLNVNINKEIKIQ